MNDIKKDCNGGRKNSGYSNEGHRNTGNYNSGCWNSGIYNSGLYNTGDWNTGHRNSGDCNIGHHNVGDWNLSSFNAGCFNTEQHKLTFFDKETDMTMDEWRESEAYHLLFQIGFRPTRWVCLEDMTDEEKAKHPEYEATGGYLQICDTDYYVKWWNKLSDHEKNIIKGIPNFDAKKFLEITGIEV